MAEDLLVPMALPQVMEMLPPGTVTAAPKCRPSSAERAKPMPPQPIHSA